MNYDIIKILKLVVHHLHVMEVDRVVCFELCEKGCHAQLAAMNSLTPAEFSSFRCLCRNAEGGDSRAAFQVAIRCSLGRGTDQSDRDAAKWCMRSAEDGCPQAQFYLAIMHFEGRGVHQDDRETLRWCRLSAKLGLPQALHFMGSMHARGLGGLAMSEEDALYWYYKAAKTGYNASFYEIGCLFCYGSVKSPTGLRGDAEAFRWWRRAAEHGHAESQFKISLQYAEGRGVSRNAAESAKWCAESARQGHRIAQFAMACKYKHGDGVVQNDMIALQYCRQSALQNLLAEAQFNMGFAYESGLIVERSISTAIEWYQLASGHLFEGQFSLSLVTS